MVFTSNRKSENINIWKIQSDGQNPVRLTNNNQDNDYPKFSPNGKQILFTSNRTGKREIWHMLSDGNNQKAVGLQSMIINDPTWSPDGTEIAYSGCTRPPNGSALSDGTCNLFKIALDASTTKQLTFGKEYDWHPDWGTEGIVFSSSRAKYNLMLIDETGNNLQQITNDNGFHQYPKWNNSTGIIFFEKTTNLSTNIWSSDISGTQQQITSINGFIWEGDSNTDGKLNCEDLYIIKASYGKRIGQDGFNFKADINNDEVVNIRDLAFVSRKLPTGTICP